jgi:aspartyl-tRNA(Asn)/glutamyl-tRNA(Gln) amidotransferase subunit C
VAAIAGFAAHGRGRGRLDLSTLTLREPCVFNSPAMDREELHVTAQLARLELSRDEEDRLEKAVFQMLEHFAKMKELDVTGLEPTAQLAQDNRLREDAAAEVAGDREALLSNAPELEDRLIVIPNVL